MARHYQWIVLIKIKHHVILGKPMVFCRIFTKAWDETLDKKYRFPDITFF